MNILEMLWGGDIHPSERTVKHGSDYERLRAAALKEYDRFWSMLTPEAKEAFNAYAEIDISLSSMSDMDYFIKGFRLGMRLLLAAIIEEETQLPPLGDG